MATYGDANDRAWADYTERFRKQTLPALLESALMISIADDVTPDTVDLRAATELGLMLMLDKPLVLVAMKGHTIGPALRRAAAAIVEDWDPTDPASQDRLTEAIKRVGASANGQGD